MRTPTIVTVVSFISIAVVPTNAGAQDQPIYLTFSVPYRLSNLHPEITSVRAVCEVPGAGAEVPRSADGTRPEPSNAGGISTRDFVRDLKRAPDGSYSGNAVVYVTTGPYKRPNTSSYNCRMEGCLADGNAFQNAQCAPFYDVFVPYEGGEARLGGGGGGGVQGGTPDVRVKVSSPQPRYTGTITW